MDSAICSSQGHKYYLVLLDDFTHFVWTIPLKFKSEVYQTFLHFRQYFQTQFELPIKAFQCDHGRKFNNSPFKLFCVQHGIIFRFSCPHTSSQNGKDERMIQTLNNISRTLLYHASIPPQYWVESLETTTYLVNLLPTKTLNNIPLTAILFHVTPSYDHIRIFGFLCFPNLTITTPHKLAPRSTPCVFLGYHSHHLGVSMSWPFHK